MKPFGFLNWLPLGYIDIPESTFRYDPMDDDIKTTGTKRKRPTQTAQNAPKTRRKRKIYRSNKPILEQDLKLPFLPKYLNVKDDESEKTVQKQSDILLNLKKDNENVNTNVIPALLVLILLFVGVILFLGIISENKNNPTIVSINHTCKKFPK